MVISDITKHVLGNGAVLIRNRKEHQKGARYEYDMKPLWSGNKRRWILLDITTANALATCYNALSPEARSRWDCIHVTRLVNFAWKHVSIG